MFRLEGIVSWREIDKYMAWKCLPRAQTSLSRCGRREGAFLWSLALHHRSLAFRALLYPHAKNEAPEEEAVEMSQQFYPGL